MVAVGEMEVLELVQPSWCTCVLWEMVGQQTGQDQQARQGLAIAVWSGQERRVFEGFGMGSCALLGFSHDCKLKGEGFRKRRGFVGEDEVL